MFKIPSDDRDNSYILRFTDDPGIQAAYPSYDKVDLYACLRGFDKLIYYQLVAESVELCGKIFSRV